MYSKFLVLSLFASTLSAHAGYAPGNPWNFGGSDTVAQPCFSLNTNSSAYSVKAYVGSSTGNNYIRFIKYQTTTATGTQWQAGSNGSICCGLSAAGSAAGGFDLGYGTAQLASADTPTTPAGSIEWAEAAAGYNYTTGSSITSFQFFNEIYQWPALVYPYVRVGASAQAYSVRMTCFDK